MNKFGFSYNKSRTIIILLLYFYCAKLFASPNDPHSTSGGNAVEPQLLVYDDIKQNSVQTHNSPLIIPHVIPGEFSKEISVEVNASVEYIFEYIYASSLLKGSALRVTVDCPKCQDFYPVLVVVRQQRGVLSWKLPIEPPPNTIVVEEYRTVSRILCPADVSLMSSAEVDRNQRLFIDISTSSHTTLNFSVVVDIMNNFSMVLMEPRTVVATPSEPVYYFFQFPKDVDMVLVKATSDDDLCAMVSIQNVSCPVFDLEENVRYGNFYQTMTLQAGITVRKKEYPLGFFIILVVLSNDDLCSLNYQHIYNFRKKTVVLLIQEKITYMEYIAAIFAGIGFCTFFYIVTVILGCVEYFRERKRVRLLQQSLMDESLVDHVEEEEEEDNNDDSRMTPTRGESSANSKDVEQIDSARMSPARQSLSSSLNEEDYDILEDAESEKDIFRTKPCLFVSDLARKNIQVLRYKSNLYIVGLLTIAIFYAVPVVQLVVTYQKVLDESGDQDSCFYNFWCAHPLGPLSDFNHVYSNIPYILFGILFILLCARRDKIHVNASRVDIKIDKYYGIPQHYGIFYSMGGALIMEGLLSGCYHICPNYSNFQFDTAFMYVIAALCMLKIYQTRHPDVNASASFSYLALAFSVLFGVIGVLDGSTAFWVIFTIIQMVTCFLLSIQIYYMGRWKLDSNILRRVSLWLRLEVRSFRDLIRPKYCDRMALLLIGNAANWGIAIYGMATSVKDFASFLLVIFVANLLLYTAFYIIMKLRHGECIQLQPLIYLILCAVSWGSGAYFFLNPMTTWERTPAYSRQFNQECSILHFYDYHDIWHFMSSSAMFFGFMLLLTLDDDLKFTPRNRIPVF